MVAGKPLWAAGGIGFVPRGAHAWELPSEWLLWGGSVAVRLLSRVSDELQAPDVHGRLMRPAPAHGVMQQKNDLFI